LISDGSDGLLVHMGEGHDVPNSPLVHVKKDSLVHIHLDPIDHGRSMCFVRIHRLLLAHTRINLMNRILVPLNTSNDTAQNSRDDPNPRPRYACQSLLLGKRVRNARKDLGKINRMWV
jgi:hypothetical protein